MFETQFLNLYKKAVALTKVPKVSRNNLKSEINFRILFYEVIDNILMQLSIRFNDTDRLIYLQLADVSKFKDYAGKFPTCALDNLKKTYPNIFHDMNKLKVELKVLSHDVI